MFDRLGELNAFLTSLLGCNPWDISYLTMCIILLICNWIQFARMLRILLDLFEIALNLQINL
jgi:hypothetical protein